MDLQPHSSGFAVALAVERLEPHRLPEGTLASVSCGSQHTLALTGAGRVMAEMHVYRHARNKYITIEREQ